METSHESPGEWMHREKRGLSPGEEGERLLRRVQGAPRKASGEGKGMRKGGQRGPPAVSSVLMG